MGLLKVYRYNKELEDQEKGQDGPRHTGIEDGCENYLVVCLNHRYDAPLSDIIPEFRRQTDLFQVEIQFLNRFGQAIPEDYRIRTDLNLYYSGIEI